MATKHRLSNIDKTPMTADCEFCGEGVPIESDGDKGVRCKLAAREIRRRYKKRNSVRQSRSKHALKGGTVCPICGPVEPVPWGRGYMCPNRAQQLGFKKGAPDPRCNLCDSFLIGGVCIYCTPWRIEIPDGFHVGELGLTARSESVVPGWRVIGPPLPEGSPWGAYLIDNDF